MANSDYVDDLTRFWESSAPGISKLQYALAVRLVRSGRYVEEALAGAAQEVGLVGRGDYEVLAAIVRSGSEGVRPADLARVAMISTSGMTGRLDRLEHSGLVERARHPSDRRGVYVRATEAGIEVAAEALQRSIARSQELFAGISDEELVSVANQLKVTLRDLADIADPMRPF